MRMRADSIPSLCLHMHLRFHRTWEPDIVIVCLWASALLQINMDISLLQKVLLGLHCTALKLN